MSDTPITPEAAIRRQRLCSEIQLFDLCDLEYCDYKEGRYCTKEDLLALFEGIKEEDERVAIRPELADDEQDGSEDDDFESLDDELEGEGGDETLSW